MEDVNSAQAVPRGRSAGGVIHAGIAQATERTESPLDVERSGSVGSGMAPGFRL